MTRAQAIDILAKVLVREEDPDMTFNELLARRAVVRNALNVLFPERE